VLGAYANYAREPWKMSAVAYHVHAVSLSDLTPASVSDFLVGYLQVEHESPRGLHLFAREEQTTSVNDAAYLRLFPQYIESRFSLGVRWDFMRRHAVTIQASDAHTRNRSFGEFRLQWSAALL
jgi:hypothetical protein